GTWPSRRVSAFTVIERVRSQPARAVDQFHRPRKGTRRDQAPDVPHSVADAYGVGREWKDAPCAAGGGRSRGPVHKWRLVCGHGYSAGSLADRDHGRDHAAPARTAGPDDA